jgi:uncharacterized protein
MTSTFDYLEEAAMIGAAVLSKSDLVEPVLEKLHTKAVALAQPTNRLEALHQVIIKTTSACNLNCSYCYVYNKGDTTWRSQPGVMSDEVFATVINRLQRHCAQSKQAEIRLTFHGGEPTLVGPERFERWCRMAREGLETSVDVSIDIQTNGTLLTPAWMDVFLRQGVQVSLSSDGPKSVHDRSRVDHKGHGSYERFARGTALLRQSGIRFGVLAVVQLGEDPVAIHRHFVSLGCSAIGYLLPAETHETVHALRDQYGETPCADYLIPVFDEWWENGTLDVPVREFWNIARVILGGGTALDSIGNPPLHFVGIQPNGAMEGLDLLGVCEPSLASIGLNVRNADFADIASLATVHRDIMKGLPLPTGCIRCPESQTCAGGYLPNRYARKTGFDNPSVWCADLLKIFAHIRGKMRVSVSETNEARRRLVRAQMKSESSCQTVPTE